MLASCSAVSPVRCTLLNNAGVYSKSASYLSLSLSQNATLRHLEKELAVKGELCSTQRYHVATLHRPPRRCELGLVEVAAVAANVNVAMPVHVGVCGKAAVDGLKGRCHRHSLAALSMLSARCCHALSHELNQSGRGLGNGCLHVRFVSIMTKHMAVQANDPAFHVEESTFVSTSSVVQASNQNVSCTIETIKQTIKQMSERRDMSACWQVRLQSTCHSMALSNQMSVA